MTYAIAALSMIGFGALVLVVMFIVRMIRDGAIRRFRTIRKRHAELYPNRDGALFYQLAYEFQRDGLRTCSDDLLFVINDVTRDLLTERYNARAVVDSERTVQP